MRNFFKKFDNINCKIFEYKVKKIIVFAPFQIELANFKFFWLNAFALKEVEVYGIMLKNSIKISYKKILKSKKLDFHCLKNH